MEIELGAFVRSSDGRDVGTIKHLILDPSDGHVKSVVLEKGLLFKEDTEAPLSALHGEGRGLTVEMTEAQLHALPRFDPEEYTEYAYSGGADELTYPPGALLWPSGNMGLDQPPGVYPPGVPMYVEGKQDTVTEERDAILRRADLANAVISTGDKVRDRDGHKVGEIGTVRFDESTGVPTEIVVHKGYLSGDVIVPGAAIDSVDDGVVVLSLGRSDIDALPREPSVLIF